jgi:hypothetical protein
VVTQSPFHRGKEQFGISEITEGFEYDGRFYAALVLIFFERQE